MASRIAGRQMESMKDLRKSLKSGGSSNVWGIPEEGIVVRFLTEPDQWFGFKEYWDDEANTYMPMLEGEEEPEGARVSSRYLAVALNTDDDRVIALKLPKTLASSLVVKYDKFGTIMDRDYELSKTGEGLKTEYDATPEGPSKRRLSKYELLDLEAELLRQRGSAEGIDDDDDDDEEEERPRRSVNASKKRGTPRLKPKAGVRQRPTRSRTVSKKTITRKPVRRRPTR